MTRQRRIRDETGGSVYYNIDEPTVGAGVFDVMKNVATSVATKLTGKAAKKIATKAAEKLVEKGAEKVGEKTGQLLGEKIYDTFSHSKTTPRVVNENRGDLIIKELQKLKKPPREKSNKTGELSLPTISQQFDALLNKTTVPTISQQFEALLNL